MDDRCRLSISRLKNSTIAELGDRPCQSNSSLFWPMPLTQESLDIKNGSMTNRVNFKVLIAKPLGIR
jgi:hypothetical protein